MQTGKIKTKIHQGKANMDSELLLFIAGCIVLCATSACILRYILGSKNVINIGDGPKDE